MATYSFLDVVATLAGPTGVVSLGSGAGNAEEGITYEQVDELNKMDIGADGTAMFSLHASKGARITVRLLKTSPINSILMGFAALQRTTGALNGQNTINISNFATGDNATFQFVAFGKIPNITYAKDGGMIEWDFLAGRSDIFLGPNV
jgi:Protein of unknown function (DUF3277)